jgi:Kef-type K+ transport system membrane component KefB
MIGTRNRSIAIVGVGMAPRGEVGLIVASFGLSLGAFPPSIFGVVVVMSLLTTIVVPPILSLLYVGDPETAISQEDLQSQAGLLPDV